MKVPQMKVPHVKVPHLPHVKVPHLPNVKVPQVKVRVPAPMKALLAGHLPTAPKKTDYYDDEVKDRYPNGLKPALRKRKNRRRMSAPTSMEFKPSELQVHFNEIASSSQENEYKREDLGDLWYTSVELKVLKSNALREGREVSDAQADTNDSNSYYHAVWHAFQLSHQGELSKPEQAKLRAVLATSPLVGLERHILKPIAKEVKARQNKLLGNIYNIPAMSEHRHIPDLLNKELRMACEKVSFPCRHFARAMALAYRSSGSENKR